MDMTPGRGEHLDQAELIQRIFFVLGRLHNLTIHYSVDIAI
jgi:hypothetical protein